MTNATVQITIICLTIIVLACIGGMIYNQSTAGTLSTLAGTGIGAIAAILVPTARKEP